MVVAGEGRFIFFQMKSVESNEIDLEAMEALVGELRSDPSKFPDERSLVRASGYNGSGAVERLRFYYHSSPAEILERARVAKAKALLVDRTHSIAEIAVRIGFQSISDFIDTYS
jgi:AraC family transcriptional regulator, regulatory protein of adaptative response / DNA-3-methyladenine glycosylase II